MKKRIFLIHGWGGGPRGGCYPWLKNELEKKGYEVIAPQMPNTETPVIEEWVNYISSLVGTPNKDTYFVGHSIGCQTIMRYLQSIDNEIGGVLLIAAWMTLENLDEEEELVAKPWIETPIDFEKLRKICKNYSVIISDDDPFGAFEYNEKIFSQDLGAKVIVLKNQGHIEGANLPIVLEEIKNW